MIEKLKQKIRCLLGEHIWSQCRCIVCAAENHDWRFTNSEKETSDVKNHFIDETTYSHYRCEVCEQEKVETETVTYEEYFQ